MMASTSRFVSASSRALEPPVRRFIWSKRSISFSFEERAFMNFVSVVTPRLWPLSPRRDFAPPSARVTRTMSFDR